MAVGSFAVLGLVLMACTARVCRITGVTALYEQIASDDMRIMFESMDEDAVEDEFGRYLSNEPDEDEGEVVERTAIGV
jgi:ribonuclease MRP protein subunit RMP1